MASESHQNQINPVFSEKLGLSTEKPSLSEKQKNCFSEKLSFSDRSTWFSEEPSFSEKLRFSGDKLSFSEKLGFSA